MTEGNPEASARAWFEKADSDLRSARLLLSATPPENDVVAFLSQQAAEKYLKGFLAYQRMDPPHTHNLFVLLDLALPYEERLENLRQAASVLRSYAVEVRYPFFENPPDAEEAAQALHRAEEICQTVRACLFGS